MIPEKLKSAFIKYRGGWLVVALAGAFFIGVLTMPIFISTHSRAACINNLMQIDGAKQTWALENHLDSNAVPSWQNIQPYFGRGTGGTLPTCPQSGIYTIGKIKDPPTCSIKGHTLD